MGLIKDNITNLRPGDYRQYDAFGENYLINGGFDYWNYASTQITSGYGSDDRWFNANTGSTKTHSLVNATDTEIALFNSSKFSRTVVTSVAGAGNHVTKYQKIENITKLAGKTVTISFWAKANTAKNIAIEFTQNFGTGGTPSTAIVGIGSQLVALTSTWQKKSITATIPSIIGGTIGTDGVHTSSSGFAFWFDAGSDFNARTASLGQQSGTFDIAEVKLEEGSVATSWTPYNGEFGGEIQACQRYYEIINNTSITYSSRNDATSLASVFTFAKKRVDPSISLVSTAVAVAGGLTGYTSTGSIILSSSISLRSASIAISGFTGLTFNAGYSYIYRSNANADIFIVSAEL